MASNRTLYLGVAILVVVSAALFVGVRNSESWRSNKLQSRLQEYGPHWWKAVVRRHDSGGWEAGGGAMLGGRPFSYYTRFDRSREPLLIQVRMPIIERDHPGIEVAKFWWKDGQIERAECQYTFDAPNMPWLEARAHELGLTLTEVMK
jgi:hypothetical protein